MSEIPVDQVVWVAVFVASCGLGIGLMVLLLRGVAAFAETVSYFFVLLFSLSLVPRLKYTFGELYANPKLLFDDLYLPLFLVGSISAFIMTARSLGRLRRPTEEAAMAEPDSAPEPSEEPEQEEQAPKPPEPTEPLEPDLLPARTRRLIFGVNDFDATVLFYRKAFGWTQLSFRDELVEFQLPDKTALGILKADVLEEVTGKTVHQPTADQIRGAQLYLRVDNLQKATKRLEDAGGRLLSEAKLRDWGDVVAYYADPNDNVIALSMPGRT